MSNKNLRQLSGKVVSLYLSSSWSNGRGEVEGLKGAALAQKNLWGTCCWYEKKTHVMNPDEESLICPQCKSLIFLDSADIKLVWWLDLPGWLRKNNGSRWQNFESQSHHLCSPFTFAMGDWGVAVIIEKHGRFPWADLNPYYNFVPHVLRTKAIFI